MSKTYITAILLFCAFRLWAQLPPECGSGQPPADNCSDACIFCDFNGLTSSTTGYGPGNAPNFCGTIENDQWLGFIAGATAATFTATAFNCTGGNGVQIALYPACDQDPVPNGCNPGIMGGANNPVSVTVALTPGVNYFLLVDGFGGDQCDFTISVNPPSAVLAPPIGNTIGAIQGPLLLCPGATATYSVPPVTNAGGYTWTVPAGWLVNGEPGPFTVIAPGGNSVQITAGNNPGNNFQLCVQASNSCYPDGPSTCKNVRVQNLPVTILPDISICNENAPYILPWGDPADVSGIYQTILNSYLGCDSIVRQTVTIKPPLFTSLPLRSICKNQCLTICGEQYCDAGDFQAVCKSFQGCDSTINFSIQVLDPVAKIKGGGTLNCINSSLLLTASVSPAVTVFNWKNPAGQILGTGNTFLVNNAGTYILTATMTGGGIQCTKSDTIVIQGNTTAPFLSANDGFLSCASDSIRLSAGTNALQPGWSWEGPNGFISSDSMPWIQTTGLYWVTVTSGINGCTATDSLQVTGDLEPPILTTAGNHLNCIKVTAPISVNANPSGSDYVWEGPNGFNAAVQTPTVSAGGTYTVTVTSSVNGCTSTATVSVTMDDDPPGATASTSGNISCPTPMVGLNGGPGLPGNTFQWSGPGFNSALEDPMVDAAGTYTLTVTGQNGCSSTATTLVTGDTIPPEAFATGGWITCTQSSIQIQGSSTTPGATFLWNGPGGFVSTDASVWVNTTGDYLLTVSAPNACTATALASVLPDADLPNAMATGDTLNCLISSVTLEGSTTTPNAQILWSGPNNFTSSLEDPLVSEAGSYTLTVTNPANGCSAQATTLVVLDDTAPAATASGGILTCLVPLLTLQANASTQGVSYDWSGPDQFISNQQNPQVQAPGDYTVTVTDPINGCSSTALASVEADQIAPVASSGTGIFTCIDTLLILQGNASLPSSFAWMGPNNFSSNLKAPPISAPGNYTLIVTAANGCTGSTSVTVLQDIVPPGVAATGDTIGCLSPLANLRANSNGGTTFNWTGPNNFLSSQQNPTVSTGGIYTVMVTGPNGCTSTAMATVVLDQASATLSIQAPEVLTCTSLAVQIQTTIQLSGQVLQGLLWSGPNQFSDTTANPGVSEPGVYTLIATTGNACTATASVTIDQDILTPDAMAQGGLLSCTVPSLNLNGGSGTPNVSFAWTGPNNFTSALEDPNVSQDGIYTLTVTGANGCSSTATASVLRDASLPDALAVSSNNLDCTNLYSTLSAFSQSNGVSFSWSGPDGFSASTAVTSTQIPGLYQLSVSAPNGCVSFASVTITLDTLHPTILVNSGTIDCIQTEIKLGNAAAPGLSYTWSGPGNFSSNEADPIVQTGGVYNLTVTGANGCTSTATASVVQDQSTASISAVAPDVLSCNALSVNIQSAIFTPGSPVQGLEWSGPNNFSSTLANPIANAPGIYTLTVTTQNGCTVSCTVTINQDIAAPHVFAAGGSLNCLASSLALNGGSTTSTDFSWTGPNNFISTLEDPMVSIDGVYTLTVTGLNGCTATAQAIVLVDFQAPGATAISSNNLNCDTLNITLTAVSAGTGVNYAWSGPNNFSAQTGMATASAPGIYQVTITGSNGCTSSASVLVTQDILAPEVLATGGAIDCLTGQATLGGNSMTPGASYTWVGPNNFNSNQANPLVSDPGPYILTVRGPNGCTASATASILENTLSPQVDISGGGTLSCITTDLNISGTIQTSGASGVWTGPNNFSSTQNSINISIPGVYTFTVTAQNGCVSAPTITVLSNTQSPQGLTASGGQINCSFPSVGLTAASGTAGVVYLWSGPGNFSSTEPDPAVTIPGIYTLVVTDPANGCTTGTSVAVTLDSSIPALVVSADSITCTRPAVVLDVNSNDPDVTYMWTGPNGFNSTLEDPITNTPGTYQVTVHSITSGCTASITYTVLENLSLPGLTAQGTTLTCTQSSGTISCSSSAPGVSYNWNGPAGFTSVLPNPTVTMAGTYAVTASGTNGCTSTTAVQVAQDTNSPIVGVNGGTITCSNAAVQLMAYANISVNLLWSGPGNFVSAQSQPGVIVPGIYSVIATAANGCTSSVEAMVLSDTQSPVVSIQTPAELGCLHPQVGLLANIEGNAPHTYLWSSPDGHFVSGENTLAPIVDQAGMYQLEVTNTANGCTALQFVVMELSDDTPYPAQILKKTISCFGANDGGASIEGISGGTPPYLFSLDQQAFTSNQTFTGLPPGNHTIQIQDVQGCSYETSFEIVEPEELRIDLGPDTSLHFGDALLISLDQTVNLPDRIAQILINPADLPLDSIFLPAHSLRYQVRVVDSSGCEATDERLILVDRTRRVYIPNVFGPGSAENPVLTVYGGQEVERIQSFQVFDRWGETIHEALDFEKNDLGKGWDGRFRGQDLMPGVFVYVARVLFKDGKTEVFRGDVTVIR